MRQTATLKKITVTLLGLLASALYFLWREDKWHKLPDLAIVLTGVMVPLAIVLVAVYWASKKPDLK